MVSTRGEGTILLDGYPVIATNRKAIGERIHPGVHIALREDTELDLLAFRQLMLYIAAGAELTLPPVPGRILDRRIECALWQGAVRIVTGPGFKGGELTIITPDAVLHARDDEN